MRRCNLLAVGLDHDFEVASLLRDVALVSGAAARLVLAVLLQRLGLDPLTHLQCDLASVGSIPPVFLEVVAKPHALNVSDVVRKCDYVKELSTPSRHGPRHLDPPRHGSGDERLLVLREEFEL